MPVAIRRVFVASTLQLSIIHAAPVRGASCHRPCGGGLRGGGLSFISVPFVVVCLMAPTIYAIQSDSKSRQRRHHINRCKH